MVDLRIIRRRANAFWRSENLPPIYDIRLFGRVCVCGWGLFSSSNAYTHTPTRTQNTLQKKLDSTCFHTGATPPFDIYNFRHRTILAHTRRACCTHTHHHHPIDIYIYIYTTSLTDYTHHPSPCVCVFWFPANQNKKGVSFFGLFGQMVASRSFVRSFVRSMVIYIHCECVRSMLLLLLSADVWCMCHLKCVCVCDVLRCVSDVVVWIYIYIDR